METRMTMARNNRLKYCMNSGVKCKIWVYSVMKSRKNGWVERLSEAIWVHFRRVDYLEALQNSQTLGQPGLIDFRELYLSFASVLHDPSGMGKGDDFFKELMLLVDVLKKGVILSLAH